MGAGQAGLGRGGLFVHGSFLWVLGFWLIGQDDLAVVWRRRIVVDGVHVVLPILVVAGLFVHPLGDAPPEPFTTEFFAHCAVAVVPFVFAHQPLGVIEAPGV
jgi:hypothetical protein